VETTNNKEDSLYPEFSHKEQVQSVTKKVKIESTVTEKFKKSSLNKDFVVDVDINLTKQILIEDFGFITKATPIGFHTVQISEYKQGFSVYRETKFALYHTEEIYPKYTWFVLTPFHSLHFWDTRKSFSRPIISVSSWLQQLQARIYPIIG
jgi:hypothetical protein